MASKTNLAGVFNTDLDNQITSDVVASTENVGGIIFDTAIVGGIAAALGAGTAATVFANGNVVELNSANEIAEAGIDDTVLLGLPKKHLEDFFTLAGDGHRLFVSFMDSSSDTNYDAVENMQVASGGIIDHIGVWTSEAIATATTVEDVTTYTVPDNNVLKKLEAQAETLGGKVGVTNYDGNSPLVIVLNAPVVDAAEFDYKNLPDLTAYDFPKVAVMLGQSSSDETHALQLKLITAGNTPKYVTVGNIGMVMACLAVAPANESIGHVANFNLANVTTTAELGFGNLTVADNAWSASVAYTNINALGYQKRNNYIHQKGYNFLTTYEGLENAVFFSGDQTLSQGDYSKIALVRVMNKSRRVVRRALLPYVNDDWEVDATTGELSATSISVIQDIVLRALNTNMVEPGTSEPQVSYKACSIASGQKILSNDALNVKYSLTPKGYTGIFNVTEGFALANS